MSSLAFQPAFDVFHTEFRLLRLRRLISDDPGWFYDQLRIADFYLLFFFRLQQVRLAPKHRSFKAIARKFEGRRYEKQPSDHLIFSRMAAIQGAAMGTLVANGYFKAEPFERGLLVPTELREPPSLASRVDALNRDEEERMVVLKRIIDEYDFLGPDGLKARTDLLEFRYDAI